MGLLAADNLIATLEGARPPTIVNPEAWDLREAARLTAPPPPPPVPPESHAGPPPPPPPPTQTKG